MQKKETEEKREPQKEEKNASKNKEVAAKKEAGKSNASSSSRKDSGKTSQSTPAAGTTDSAQPKPAKSGSALGIIAIILALAGLGGSYIIWQSSTQSWQQSSDTQKQLIDRVDETVASIGTIQPEVSSVKSGLASLQSDLTSKLDQDAQAIKTTQDTQKIIKETLESIQEEVGKEEDRDWVLAEVDYLIRIANNRLLLERDVDTAIAALSTADTRLKALGHPALIETRRLLADEITALKAVAEVDLAGMGLTLSSLQDRVEELPLKDSPFKTLKQDVPAPDLTSSISSYDWQAVATELWGMLKGLVTIKKIGDADIPLLSPEQRDFLAQNLRLKLETARLSLFRHDDPSFHASLKTTRDWVNQYFDADAANTKGMLKSIDELDKVKLNAPMPDVSGSLNALRKVMASITIQPPVLPARTKTNSEGGA
ncbi:MAG: uroporphyrinogen-III C-methyltransferase [Gammaproteobacteria bacterium]